MQHDYSEMLYDLQRERAQPSKQQRQPQQQTQNNISQTSDGSGSSQGPLLALPEPSFTPPQPQSQSSNPESTVMAIELQFNSPLPPTASQSTFGRLPTGALAPKVLSGLTRSLQPKQAMMGYQRPIILPSNQSTLHLYVAFFLFLIM